MSPHSIKGVTMVELKQDGIKETTMQTTLKTQEQLTFTGHIAALSQHWKIIHGNPTKIICQVKLQQWKMFLKDEDELQLSEQ
jgi:hypothetical protein